MTRLPRTLFETPLPGIGRPLTEPEADQLDKYVDLLIKWQKPQRLVGSSEPGWIIDNIFIDSLGFLEALPPGVQRVADIGSGAGVPGVPIAIVRPDLKLSLIEARQRRVSFLSTVIRDLGLTHAEVVGARVEALEGSHGGRFDAVVMRCAGDLMTLLPRALALLKSGGAVITSAGPSQGTVPFGGELLAVQMPGGGARGFWRHIKP